MRTCRFGCWRHWSRSPGSTQVRLEGLDRADDLAIWNYAKEHGYVIVTKDSDFHEFSLLYGSPPKVLWLKCGNRPKWYVLGLLLNQHDAIDDFFEAPDGVCLELY
ncbi:MAG: DUF5615 family PIN-like protein [Gammaproteobacteria bacterium]